MHGDSDLLVLRCARETKIVVVVVFWHARFVAWIKRSVCLCCCSFSVCNAKRHDSDDDGDIRHGWTQWYTIVNCLAARKFPFISLLPFLLFLACRFAFWRYSFWFCVIVTLFSFACHIDSWQYRAKTARKTKRRCLCENIHAKAINHHRLGQTQTQTHHSRIPFPFRPFAMLRTSGLTRSKYRCAN